MNDKPKETISPEDAGELMDVGAALLGLPEGALDGVHPGDTVEFSYSSNGTLVTHAQWLVVEEEARDA